MPRCEKVGLDFVDRARVVVTAEEVYGVDAEELEAEFVKFWRKR